MKNKLTHEQLLEETGKCNKLGAKCVDMSNRLRLLEAYHGTSNGGDVYGMLNQLDFIIRDLQKIRNEKY